MKKMGITQEQVGNTEKYNDQFQEVKQLIVPEPEVMNADDGELEHLFPIQNVTKHVNYKPRR